jgi:hypothetical protein
MTTQRFSGLTVAVYIVLAWMITGKAIAADSLKVSISIFSGRPDPVFTLSDSGSVSLIKLRLGFYLVRSTIGDPGAPMPLTTAGYRGVLVDAFTPNSIYNCFLSNGSITFDHSSSDRRFFDYGSELQKMVLRLLKRELTVHPQTDSDVLSLLPDSLTRDHTEYGIITIELNNQFYQIGCTIDASRLGMGNRYLSPVQDSIVVPDFSIVLAEGNAFKISSRFGVAEVPQLLPGLAPVSYVQPEPSSTLPESYRSVMLLANLQPTTLAWQQQVTFTDISTTGRTFIIKTSEGGYVALITAGCYIGGYDRLHLFRYYTTATEFSAPLGISAIENTAFHAKATIPASYRKSARINLSGQKIESGAPLRNRVLPGKPVVVR